MTTQTDIDVNIESVGKVPVRNIWFLLLYAYRLYRELPDSRRVILEETPNDLPALVAEILANAVQRRLRRSLSSGYQRRHDVLNRVRGRIDLLTTERDRLLQRARVSCRFDELTVDTLRNRYVREALKNIAVVVSADNAELGRRCRDLARRLEMAGATGYLDPKRIDRSSVLNNTGWSDSHERRMLMAAWLALNLALPTEQIGSALLPIINRREIRGWQLYEEAVAGFYEGTLTQDWRVTPQSPIAWPLEGDEEKVNSLVPGMVRDIVLESRNQRIVIDTKFTEIVSTGQYGNTTFKSGNIYQLYAYLRSQEDASDPLSLHSTGVLLYPAIDACVDESATIQGHRIRFSTVNLAAETQTIRNQLLRIVDAWVLNLIPAS